MKSRIKQKQNKSNKKMFRVEQRMGNMTDIMLAIALIHFKSQVANEDRDGEYIV